MGRVNDENWLDEALDEAVGSHDTQPDFEQWKANHPEAVEMFTSRARPNAARPPAIRRIRMNATLVKLAAAAVIAIAAIFGVTQLMQPNAGDTPTVAQTLTGPMTHTFDDGSAVTLAANASIRTYGQARQRGFEHLAGAIDVTVAKGKGEFIVTTPYGNVKALGTEFTMDMVDGVADTGEKVQLLTVEVTEGSVEVSNAKGAMTLEGLQQLVVEADSAPYDFNQDERLPVRLRERMAAMMAALETGDARAWMANFNIQHMYDMVKGNAGYDANLFGGSEADFQRLKEAFADVKDVQELTERALAGVNIKEPHKVYMRSAQVNEAGDHAQGTCIDFRGENRYVITSPQWHFFDNDWWQVDD